MNNQPGRSSGLNPPLFSHNVGRGDKMESHGFQNNEDFYNFIRAMCFHLEQLGFNEASEELTRLMNSAWTTSSELFGEIGLASERILKRDGSRLPLCLADDLR